MGVLRLIDGRVVASTKQSSCRHARRRILVWCTFALACMFMPADVARDRYEKDLEATQRLLQLRGNTWEERLQQAQVCFYSACATCPAVLRGVNGTCTYVPACLVCVPVCVHMLAACGQSLRMRLCVCSQPM